MIARRKRRGSKGKRQEYRYSPMIWIRDATGRHQIWGGTFRTKAEANAAERKLIQDRDVGADLKPSKVTVAEVCQQYIAEKRNKVKASTLQRSQELLAHVVTILGPTQVSRLRPTDISAAYKELEARLARRTVRHCHWQLHGALELAVRWGQVPVNVAGRVDPPEPAAFEGRALNQDEVRILLEAVQSTELAALVWLAIDSGARQGELLALTADDVDFENRLVHIGRSVRRIRGQGMTFSPPKTRLSRRTVEIAPATMSVLRAHRALQLERRMKAGELWDQSQNLFFPTATGGAQDGVSITKAFKKIARAAGLGAGRFHDLRHTSVSLLLEAGAKMDDVRARVGHRSITTTVNVYGHRVAGTSSIAATMNTILTDARANDSAGWLANG